MFVPVPFQSAINETKPNLYKKETVEDLVKYAEKQSPGSIHMVEVQIYPPSFAVIKVDENQKLHTEIVTDNSNKSYPRDQWETFPLAYKWHTEDIVRVGRFYSETEFRILFNSVNTKIDKAIETHHGINCGAPMNAEGT